MKGIVFTEFLELVETAFGSDIADDIIEESSLESGGAYTAVGNYDWQEIVTLVVALSAKSGKTVPELVHTFGHYLFGRFFLLYPSFFEQETNSLGFLEGIEDRIHAEVRKLYPDAQVPNFDVERTDEKTLVMTYSSHCPFANLAAGLIDGCIEHFGDEATVEKLELGKKDGTHAQFTVRL